MTVAIAVVLLAVACVELLFCAGVAAAVLVAGALAAGRWAWRHHHRIEEQT